MDFAFYVELDFLQCLLQCCLPYPLLFHAYFFRNVYDVVDNHVSNIPWQLSFYLFRYLLLNYGLQRHPDLLVLSFCHTVRLLFHSYLPQLGYEEQLLYSPQPCSRIEIRQLREFCSDESVWPTFLIGLLLSSRMCRHPGLSRCGGHHCGLVSDAVESRVMYFYCALQC